MKIRLNLSVPDSRRERYGLLWAIPAALAALVGLMVFSVSVVKSVRQFRSIHRSVLGLQEREKWWRDQKMTFLRDLERTPMRQISREAQFVNTLIDRKRMSLPGLTATVSKLLPGAVRLTGLALYHEGTNAVVRLQVTGRSEEALETFLNNLEDAAEFADVTIVNQGFEEQGTGGGDIAIVCTARYLGAGIS